ncbi:50S ribosomal protein L25/general stress protein Ctc [Oleidesulfovibrio alaskensis]|jgi:large subunit ribosomal protein L25|uniref:50S ribosomal protein L25/general stress protein Ctc n=1 Tax=Oleidesulfovibrio alaskensis TaxID=58180 RepID=UPI001A4EC8DC|nr:50S ribosomal protein L25/general stress protein Ctc [Oleidesulfovibrio alaskensis]MBL3581061.1 50S ribosomal protein L25/general stress protein Ctc [Oleidesulfovibrio alaskensis]
MSQQMTLSVQKREGLGKGANRKLRTAKKVPGIFYNSEGKNIPVAIDGTQLEKLYETAGKTTVFNLDIEGETAPCLIWQIERHPYKPFFTHVDLFGVDMEKPIKARIPLKITGVAKGTKIGGRMEVYRDFVDVFTKPGSMPKVIDINVSNMEMGDAVHVADLKLEDGHCTYDSNYVIVRVSAPRGGKGEEGEDA